MVKGTMQLSIGAALYALLLLLCVSCSDDDETSPVVSDEANSNTVTIGLKVRAAYGYDEDGKYETGSEYENYLNIADGDYRIYFFDADNNTYITKFEPDSVDVVPVEDSNYTEYSMLGRVPEDLLTYGDNDVSSSTFKIVMLANWGNTYDESGFSGSTTIESICNADWAVFDHLENFELSSSSTPKRLIPFYGVNTYENVTFKANQATILDNPLTLLRAMAKVEVLFDSDFLEKEPETKFTDVRVIHYNDQGYCAPEKAYAKDDYDHSYDYGKDFVGDVHLVGGYNDYDTEVGVGTPIERSLQFKSNDDGTWYAYLPEYKNTSTDYADDYAYIEVKFTYRGYVEGPYGIYFADYDEKTGTTDNTSRYDILRNNLYRFTISLDEYLRVHVNKWIEEWTNDFYFGNSVTDIIEGDEGNEGNN